ncbi:MAG TPA: hypothetical protein VF748_15135 [Candidatus Acidoferrum sp.]
MRSAGIDYGLGSTNIDTTTGIRCGVISQHAIGQAWADESEPEYGEPMCPKCGHDAVDLDAIDPDDNDIPAQDEPEFAEWTAARYEMHDYACRACKHFFGSESAFGDDPRGWMVDDGKYQMVDCLDSDVMVIRSPFYTFGPYCSPCVPGAINLDDAAYFCTADGPEMDEACLPRAYCPGHDWFENSIAPYPVFGVVSGRQCFPDHWYATGYFRNWTRPELLAMPASAQRSDYCV